MEPARGRGRGAPAPPPARPGGRPPPPPPPADPAAFGELYDFYLPRIYGYLVRRSEMQTVAEDLTATTFERALTALRAGDFRNESFGGWLYRVASNALVDHVRRSRRYVPLGIRASDAGIANAGDVETVVDDRAVAAFTAALDRDEIGRALAELPEGHRRAIVLRYVDGLEGDELAGALGCSRGTAAVRVHRALRALRARLTKESIDAA
jgi:RNA polymerase sigma-70 factor (ECF subfamily)